MSLINNKKIVRLILLLFSFFSLYACTGSKTAATQNNDFPGEAVDSLIASIERTRCYGVCPHYKILFYRSGYVVYEGYDHVTKIGRYYTFINKDQLSSIGIKAEETGYFNLNDSYRNPHLTDFPTIYSEVRFRGKAKKITRYDAEPPSNLVEMENYLDKVIPKDQLWVKHPIQDLKE